MCFVIMQPVEDDEQTRRSSGIALTRPFPRVVKASHVLGWLLIAVGLAEIVVGSLVFNGEVCSTAVNTSRYCRQKSFACH